MNLLEKHMLKTRDSWWVVMENNKKVRIAKKEKNKLIITNGISNAENKRQNGNCWKEYEVITASEVSHILRNHFSLQIS